jgi:hypothetical protein
MDSFGPQPGMALMAAIDPLIPFGPQPGTSFSESNTTPDQAVSMTSVAKLLLLISMLHKGNRLTSQEKDSLKLLALQSNANMVSALECYEVDKDLYELSDTLRSIVGMSGNSSEKNRESEEYE